MKRCAHLRPVFERPPVPQLHRGSASPVPGPCRASGLDRRLRRSRMRRSPASGSSTVPGTSSCSRRRSFTRAAPSRSSWSRICSRLTRDMAELLRVTTRLRLKGVELVRRERRDRHEPPRREDARRRQGAHERAIPRRSPRQDPPGALGIRRPWLERRRPLFGYRTVPVRRGGASGDRGTTGPRSRSTRRGGDRPRIFRAYAAGRSMKAIAHALNAERVPFPAKDTKRGPARRGWAVSTVRVILRNEKYAGDLGLEQDPLPQGPGLRSPPTGGDGRRTSGSARSGPSFASSMPTSGPPCRRACVRRRGLRLRVRTAAAGPGLPRIRPISSRGSCAAPLCGARMVAARRSTRRKGGRVYCYGWYRCCFAAHEGPGHLHAWRRVPAAIGWRPRCWRIPGRDDAADGSTLTQLVNTHVDAAAFRQRSRASST